MLPIRLLISALIVTAGAARADVTPASLFCDHAVLQQGMPIPIWGTADEGEKVTVELAGQIASTIARGGQWSVRLAPLPAGGPHQLTITGRNRVAISDVLIGEVWVCSGQSNMERQLGLREWQQPIKNWEAEAAAADFPQIRHFGVAQRLALDPQTHVAGRWAVCTPQTVLDFTAVGFFFGRALHLARGVPIGLIHSSWGGTPAEAWTSREGIEQVPELAEMGQRLDRIRLDPVTARTEFERNLAQWFVDNDPGSTSRAPWSAEECDTKTWAGMRLPGLWERNGLPDFDGVVWFRRDIEVPTEWRDRETELHLGAIDDIDATWVNGRYVAGTTVWNKPRVYPLPAGTLQAGRNVIAVRVLDTGGGGGLWGTDAMRLVRSDAPEGAISLEGEWRYKASVFSHKSPPPPVDPSVSPGTPTVPYNGMIAPLQPYAIRGVIWYQGEANAGQAEPYRRIFPNLVADWRRAWDQGEFPFLYVQIAPFREMPPEIREAQRLSLAKIPNSAMAVTLDVGDTNDIHPTDKKPVGPKKDLTGGWAAAARKHGLRFGVSVHASHAWMWYEPAQRADKAGPFAGVPYDVELTQAEGKGLWWEGLDPQDLYAQNHQPGGYHWEWDATQGSSVPDAAYMEKFFKRTKQLWDDYQPDQIYFDDTVLPFRGVTDEVGLKLAAHFYNTRLDQRGRTQAVMNGKKLSETERRTLVYDIERGKAQDILPEPWQTDTCIGSWHYDRGIYERKAYKSAAAVVRMLSDIVSKNGILMLSVPLRGDGQPDELEIEIVKEIGAWLKVNGEAIYATRPWKIYGEGPSTEHFEKGVHDGQKDVSEKPFTAEDIRFTRSKDGKMLYAIVLETPRSGEVTIKSLAAGSPHWPGKIGSVQLVGGGKLKFTREADGLRVALPKNFNGTIALALKIGS